MKDSNRRFYDPHPVLTMVCPICETRLIDPSNLYLPMCDDCLSALQIMIKGEPKTVESEEAPALKECDDNGT